MRLQNISGAFVQRSISVSELDLSSCNNTCAKIACQDKSSLEVNCILNKFRSGYRRNKDMTYMNL